jgi:hypothetical protein
LRGNHAQTKSHSATAIEPYLVALQRIAALVLAARNPISTLWQASAAFGAALRQATRQAFASGPLSL